MHRTEILSRADDIINGARNEQYGEPEDNFRLIAELWNVYLQARKKFLADKGESVRLDRLDTANMMMLVKIARAATGAGSLDTYIDIAGYAACAGSMIPELPEEEDED